MSFAGSATKSTPPMATCDWAVVVCMPSNWAAEPNSSAASRQGRRHERARGLRAAARRPAAGPAADEIVQSDECADHADRADRPDAADQHVEQKPEAEPEPGCQRMGQR